MLRGGGFAPGPLPFASCRKRLCMPLFTDTLFCRCQTVGGVCTWWRQVSLEANLLPDLNLNCLPLFSQARQHLHGSNWQVSMCCCVVAVVRIRQMEPARRCLAHAGTRVATCAPGMASLKFTSSAPASFPRLLLCSARAACPTSIPSATRSLPGCCPAATRYGESEVLARACRPDTGVACNRGTQVLQPLGSTPAACCPARSGKHAAAICVPRKLPLPVHHF